MATVINLHKAIREIRLDDSEDSPAFILDLTDKAIQQKAVKMAGCCVVYMKLVERMKAEGLTEDIASQVLSVYHIAIDTLLGEGSFDIITNWLRSDQDIVQPQEMSAAYAPLIEYLFNEYNAVMTANQSKAVERYLNDDLQLVNPL